MTDLEKLGITLNSLYELIQKYKVRADDFAREGTDAGIRISGEYLTVIDDMQRSLFLWRSNP